MKNRIFPLVVCSLLVLFTADPALAQDSALDQLKKLNKRLGGTAGSVSVPDVGPPICASCGGKGGHHSAGCPYGTRPPTQPPTGPTPIQTLQTPRAFELGKRKLLKMLKGVDPSQPPVIKGAVKEQSLGSKPAATLRARGHPIVVREALGSIEYSDLKSILAEMSDEDLQLLARFATKREEEFVSRIKRVEEKKFQATLRARTIPNFKTWKEVLWEKIKDIAPLWRLMEQMGKKAAGDLSQIKTDDIYKGMQDAKKFYDVIQGRLPTPDQLAEYGKKTAKKGAVVLKIGTELVDISWRLGDMYIFNKSLRDEQKAGQVLALELAVRRNDLERKLNETRKLQKRVEEELKHR